MKNVFIVLAALSLTLPAMASKSRMNALQGATFLVDTQTVFENPAHIHANGQLMTLEMGGTANTATPKAEGGIFRKESDLVYGVYLGHIDSFQAFRVLAGVPVQENPVEAFFGKDNWGASVALSNGNKKTTSVKDTTLLGRFGMVDGSMEYYGELELISKSENATLEYEGKIPTLSAGFEKDAGRFYYGANLVYGKADIKTKATGVSTDSTVTAVELSMIDRSMKTADRELYYGVMLDYVEVKTSKKKTSLKLPVVIGLETKVTSWAMFRGSVQQNILLGNTKDETATAPADESDTIANDTTVAVGVGLFSGNFTLDGTVAASSTGQMNGNQVLTDASVTYKF